MNKVKDSIFLTNNQTVSQSIFRSAPTPLNTFQASSPDKNSNPFGEFSYLFYFCPSPINTLKI